MMCGHCVTQSNYQALTHRYKTVINLSAPFQFSVLRSSLTSRHQLLFLQLPFDVPVQPVPRSGRFLSSALTRLQVMTFNSPSADVQPVALR